MNDPSMFRFAIGAFYAVSLICSYLTLREYWSPIWHPNKRSALLFVSLIPFLNVLLMIEVSLAQIPNWTDRILVHLVEHPLDKRMYAIRFVVALVLIGIHLAVVYGLAKLGGFA